MNAGLITMDGFAAPEPAPRFASAQPARKVVGVSDDEDAQLMLAYAAGEMRAFETLYGRHRNRSVLCDAYLPIKNWWVR